MTTLDERVAKAIGDQGIHPIYSIDVTAAIAALEAFCKARGLWYEITRWANAGYTCAIYRGKDRLGEPDGDTLPLAICHAIVAAVEVLDADR